MYNDLSIVFQGPVIISGNRNYTIEALNSAITHFPGAEIIFSTWVGAVLPEEYTENKGIKIIYNIDPGSGVRKDKPITYHNVNRIIISSLEGLKYATRRYCIKTRSDMIFDSSNCLLYLFRFNMRNDIYSLFKDRIVVSNQTSINPTYGPKLLYHICDWFFLGRKEDLIKLYDVKLFEDNLQARWYNFHPKPENSIDKNNLSLFMAEDYVIATFFKKYINIRHEFYCDYDKSQQELSEKLIASNFVVVDNKKLGIHSGKYESLSRAYLWKCYTYQEWINLYNAYVLSKNKSQNYTERLYLLLLCCSPLLILRLLKQKITN